MPPRALTRAIAIAALCLAVAQDASAGPLGPTYTPPFTKAGTSRVSGLAYPCTIRRAPVRARTPDPAAGRLDSSAGVSVRTCRGHGTARYERWALGEVPSALVGYPGEVVAVVDVTGFSTRASGMGTFLADVRLKIGNDDLAGRGWWTLVAVECVRTCRRPTRTTPSEERLTLRREISSLPPALTAIIATGAGGRGTGLVAAEFLGTLQSVVVRPVVPIYY